MRVHADGETPRWRPTTDANVHFLAGDSITGSLSGHLSSELVSDGDVELQPLCSMLGGDTKALENKLTPTSLTSNTDRNHSTPQTQTKPDPTPAKSTQTSPEASSTKSYTAALKSPVSDPLSNYRSSLTKLPSASQKAVKKITQIHTTSFQACMNISKCFGNISCSVMRGWEIPYQCPLSAGIHRHSQDVARSQRCGILLPDSS